MKKFTAPLMFGKHSATFFVALTMTLGVFAQSVPSLINYQGRLTDQNGNPLPAGIYGIQFRIWDSATATNGAVDLIWGQQQTVTLQSNGLFNVILGSSGGTNIAGTTPLVSNLGYAFAGPNCFLGLTIAVSNGVTVSTTEILPRQQFLSVPYALNGLPAGAVTPWAGIGNGSTPIPVGWLVANGQTIGNAASGANYANQNAVNLYQLLWNSLGTNLLIYANGTATGPGVSAMADFNAGNSLAIPDLRGRTAIGAGQGTSLSMRIVGQSIGEEKHTLTEAEMPAHNHGGVTGTDYPDHTHSFGGYQFGASYGGDNQTFNPNAGNFGFSTWQTAGASTRHQHSIPTDGGNQAHNVMQPSMVLTYLIKL